MRVLGIDPGYDRVGLAVIEKLVGKKEVLLFSNYLQTSAKDSFFVRLEQVGQEITKIIKEYKPTDLAIESLFITKNQKTAMRVSEARGVLIYEAIKNGLNVHEYTPLQIKIAVTGYGASDKTQVTKMIPLLVKLPTKNTKDDEYDAIAVALTCLAHQRKSFPQK